MHSKRTASTAKADENNTQLTWLQCRLAFEAGAAATCCLHAAAAL